MDNRIKKIIINIYYLKNLLKNLLRNLLKNLLKNLLRNSSYSSIKFSH